MVLLAMPRGILFLFQRAQPCCSFVFNLPGHTGVADAQWQMIQCPCSGSWIHPWVCVVLVWSHTWGLRSNCFCDGQEQKVSGAPTPACKSPSLSLSALLLKQPLHRSVLVITKSVLLTSRDCAAENRHIIPANLALMGTWFLLVLRGCAAPFPWPYIHLPGEKALERVGGLATGLLLMWMGTGEGTPGTPVPVSRACSTLREKFLHFYGCLTLNTEK